MGAHSESLGTHTGHNGALWLLAYLSRGIFCSSLKAWERFPPVLSTDLAKSLLPRPHSENHNPTHIYPSRTTRKEARRKEWLGLYRPCQPMSVLTFCRSASRPIRVSRCNLRLHSALFADAGSVGAAAASETLSFFIFFPCVHFRVRRRSGCSRQ